MATLFSRPRDATPPAESRATKLTPPLSRRDVTGGDLLNGVTASVCSSGLDSHGSASVLADAPVLVGSCAAK